MRTWMLSLVTVGLSTAGILSFSPHVAACDSGACDGQCHHRAQHVKPPRGGIMGMMPQTQYEPPYGCYPGSSRFTNRYPAFHGTYYSHAYNYRNYFDYPHHAGMHEPTSLFSYHTDPTAESESQSPAPVVPAKPAVSEMSAATMRSAEAANFAPVVRAAKRETLAPVVGKPIRSLRR